MKMKKTIIWLVIIIAVATAVYYLGWKGEKAKELQTAEEIQKEIERLQQILKQAEEDTKKAESGEVTCILIYAPVCGKDGKTYSNECFANAAGVEIAHKGECQ